jgi:hypothetical protein
MKAPTPQYVVYLVGLALLGLFYRAVKEALGGGGVFFLALVGYLVVLRLAGWLVARLWASRSARNG